MADNYVLFHSEGCGSIFSLVLLRLFDCPHEVVKLDYNSVTGRKDSPELRRLLEANPLAQFPTLVTPDGGIMTETAAIALYLNHRHGANSPWGTSHLASPQLAAFYRWLIYLPANIYPTISIVEFPERYIAVPAEAAVTKEVAAKWVSAGTMERREDAWMILERNFGVKNYDGRFFLGTEQPTMLDVYISMMAHWPPDPRYQWLKKNCPKILKLTMETLDASSVVLETFAQNGLDMFVDPKGHAKEPEDKTA